jgi:hypothetical protein
VCDDDGDDDELAMMMVHVVHVVLRAEPTNKMQGT